jgi:hypothetical protein
MCKEELSARHRDCFSKLFILSLRLIYATLTIARGLVVDVACYRLANHWFNASPRANEITIVGPLLLYKAKLISNVGLEAYEQKTNLS